MTALWMSALVLGAAGSAHCVGMCGPIALAVPNLGHSRVERTLSMLLLNGGRLFTYALLGLVFGAFGQGLHLVGLQQSVSMIAGVLLIVAALVPSALGRIPISGRLALALSRARGILARHLRRTSPEAIWFSGMLNGLLPCGLVYTAAVGAATVGNAVEGAWLMALFGAGTLPALTAVGLGGSLMRGPWRERFRKAAPIAMAALGVLLLVRSAGWGIPYVSPGAPTLPYQLTTCP